MANPNQTKGNTPAKQQGKKKADKKAQESAPLTFGAYAPGMLNPSIMNGSPSIYADVRDLGNSFTSLLTAVGVEQTIPDIARNIGPVRGICLSIEGQQEQNEKSRVINWYNFFEKDTKDESPPPKLIQMRVRIPELHYFLPIPSDPEDKKTISLYPTYVALDTAVSLETYVPGDVVIVDHQNKDNLQGGVLLGPVKRTPPQQIVNIYCQNAQYNPNGAQGSSQGTSVPGHTGAKMAPLRKRDQRTTAVIMGGDGIAGTFGNKIQEWLFSKGIALAGSQGVSPVVDFADPKNLNVDFRVKLGSGTPETTIGKDDSAGWKEAKKALSFKPDYVIYQFDNYAESGGNASAARQHLLAAIKKIKKLAAPKRIFIIGTTANSMRGSSFKLDSAAGNQTPNIPWVQSWSSTNSSNTTAIDPLKSWAGAKSIPNGLAMAKRVIADYFGKIQTAAGPPPAKPDKTKKKSKNPKGYGNYLAGLMPKITNAAQGRSYLIQLATRLGYDTGDKKPAHGGSWWKDMLERQWQTSEDQATCADGKGGLCDAEMAMILNVPPPKLSSGTPPNQSSPSPKINTGGFPDADTANMIREKLTGLIVAAIGAIKKGEAGAADAAQSQQPAAAGAGVPCGPGGGMNFGPGGHTYRGPATVVRNDINKSLRKRPGRVKSVLMIYPSLERVKKKEGAGWPKLIAAVDAVSLKILDGTGNSWWKSKKIQKGIKELKALGVPLHGWGFHYCQTVAKATAEARKAAKLCKEAGMVGYWWNAEKHFMGVEDQPPAIDPTGAAMTFAHIFKKNAPGVALYACCYQGRKVSASTKKGYPERPGLEDKALAFFDGFAPMDYGTRPGTVARKHIKRAERAKALNIPFCPTVCPGNTTASGNTWGWANDQGSKSSKKWNKTRSKNAQGLLSLCLDHPTAVVNYWYGAHGQPGLGTVGNKFNPSLISLSAALRAGSRGPLKVGDPNAVGVGGGGGQNKSVEPTDGSPKAPEQSPPKKNDTTPKPVAKTVVKKKST